MIAKTADEILRTHFEGDFPGYSWEHVSQSDWMKCALKAVSEALSASPVSEPVILPLDNGGFAKINVPASPVSEGAKTDEDFLTALKFFTTDFFYWWYNAKGTNTRQGFDEYLTTENGKGLYENLRAALEDSGSPSPANQEADYGMRKGDYVRCLFGNSGHKFWPQLRGILLVEEVIPQGKGVPPKLKFAGIEKAFYANDFEKLEEGGKNQDTLQAPEN